MAHKAQVLNRDCSGPNRNCRKAHRAGRMVHVIPTPGGIKAPSLVMPTYHFRTVEEGMEAIRNAIATAPTVYADADLYLFREQNIPHFLPVGWVDPTMRRS